jgi:hypothetical protein
MNTSVVTTVGKNLALLALVAMPLFFVLTWIQGLLGQAARATDLGYVAETGGVYYLSNLIPVLVGGLIHQIFWLVLPRTWPSARRRIVALLLAPVIPVAVLLAWGGSAGSLLYFAVPMLVTLVVYVLLIRLPSAPAQPAT